jgi:hypothetical protein
MIMKPHQNNQTYTSLQQQLQHLWGKQQVMVPYRPQAQWNETRRGYHHYLQEVLQHLYLLYLHHGRRLLLVLIQRTIVLD